ncbi:DUF397 domain-containing protein [Actinophytocola algeriensis]|uniref:DUF397 domain-containing protein n=1 Tax=Actinophytocola algeriensis TaxID=1768010 RepID=UPI002892BB26|nr:DUF397 domain-containing protein [Actinophytocola algeriensis]
MDLVWRKSSRSGQDHTNGNCVEVAHPGLSVAVRDSKSPERGILVVSAPAWARFLHVTKM